MGRGRCVCCHPCVFHLTWFGLDWEHSQASPVNSVLASQSPTLCPHYPHAFPARTPCLFPWQQILPLSHPPRPGKLGVGAIRAPFLHPLHRRVVTSLWHHTELRLATGWQRTLSLLWVLGFMLPLGLPVCPPRDMACPSMPKELNLPSPWGVAALPTLEASHLGGPAFRSVNSHVCKFTCVWVRSHGHP